MGNKEDAIAALNKWSGIPLGKSRIWPTPSAPPPEVLDDPENQMVAKDMTIQALRDDLKSRLAGELETAWSYVALFVVAAAKLAEVAASPGDIPTVSVDGANLEQIFAEYEIRQKKTPDGVTLTVIKRSSQKVVLTLPIGMFPLAEDEP